MRHPALIFIAVLMRPINTAHAKHQRGNSIRARVINDVLISGAFGTAVRTMKVERPVFSDSSLANRDVRRLVARGLFREFEIGEISVNLVGGSKNEGWR